MKIVYSHVMNLINAGVHAEDIAIISPYNLQVLPCIISLLP